MMKSDVETVGVAKFQTPPMLKPGPTALRREELNLGRRDKTTVVICPSVGLPAEVRFDLDRLAESCSRWPELQGCSRSCMVQVKFSAEGLNDFAARYEGKKCALCGTVLTRDDWYKSRLAALDVKTKLPETAGTVGPSFFSIPENRDPICPTCCDATLLMG